MFKAWYYWRLFMPTHEAAIPQSSRSPNSVTKTVKRIWQFPFVLATVRWHILVSNYVRVRIAVLNSHPRTNSPSIGHPGEADPLSAHEYLVDRICV
jgi:hypothetical protein